MICFYLINRESCSVLRPVPPPPLRKGVFMYSCGELLTRGLNSGKRKHPLFFLDPPSPPRFIDVANGKTDYGSLKTPLGKWRPRLHQDSYKIWRADKVALTTTGGWQGRFLWRCSASETACRLDTHIGGARVARVVENVPMG